MRTVRGYSEETDAQLLMLLKEDDQHAFTAIYDRYVEKLFAIAYSFSKRKEVAEEITQDVFMRLWDRRRAVEINSLSAYLATAIKFSVLVYLQKELRRKKILDRMPTLCVSYSGESDADVLFLKRTLENAVHVLPEKCKIVYQYSRESGMSVKEIAEKMQLSPKTVENHLYRALQALRIALKKDYFFLTFFFVLLFFEKNGYRLGIVHPS